MQLMHIKSNNLAGQFMPAHDTSHLLLCEYYMLLQEYANCAVYASMRHAEKGQSSPLKHMLLLFRNLS